MANSKKINLEQNRKRTRAEIDNVRDRVRAFYLANPDKSDKRDVGVVMTELGLSPKDKVIVESIRRELGLVKAASSTARPHFVKHVNADALKEAVESAGDGERLIQILELVQKAGGVDVVKATLHQYKLLHQILG